MNNKLVVLSFDALQSTDLKKLIKMPNFSKIFQRASVIKNMYEIYPTLTYPIHTTMLTGVYPDKHGITHNQLPSLYHENPDFNIMGSKWHWEKKYIKVPTLVDVLQEKGKTTASVLWPVTGGEKRGWNLPEIWPDNLSDESVEELFYRTSSKNVFDRYYNSYISHYNWSNTEDMLNYGVEIALDILENERPDLLLCHIIHLDHVRHKYGVESKEVDDCLRQLDIIAGRFIEATKKAGTYNSTNFVMLGDHGQINIDGVFSLNKLFADYGLITLNKGKVVDYECYSFSAGFSTQIFLKEDSEEMYKKVLKILNIIRDDYPQYIERIYTADEVALREGLRGDFSFVVEGKEGVLFGEKEVEGEVFISSTSEKFNYYKATHGHHPVKGTKPPFVALGPDIKENMVLERGKIIDIAPTLAKLCGVEIEGAVGSPVNILKGVDEIIKTKEKAVVNKI
ncbi:alkaline phosphatase family protein [Anaerosphaera multitolerans]|uniref:Alkaline phosphatase family protein n=1 Tax=Anaerosphaera multitolerans TaxID=2487351 RepID=A0A437S9B2_9FIRM|nr:alkaline phosphatase family protein [Anaerosphaera multitolerans]RVU55705.1 alkaline phosphatase family protein [Anaerosphaera multitolerans]